MQTIDNVSLYSFLFLIIYFIIVFLGLLDQ